MSIFKRNQDPPLNLRSPADVKPPSSLPEVSVRPLTPSDVLATPRPASPGAAPATTVALDRPVRDAAAVLDKKTEITGTLHSDGNVLIEGRFDGEIEAKETVWVERGARSKGQLRANDAVLSGSVEGEIACQHRLQIAATAVVDGEINTPVLVIEDGATINCRFNMVRMGGKSQ